MKLSFRNEKGEIAMDQVGYIILALVLLLILIYIVAVVLGGKIENEGDKVGGIFDMFK